MDHIESIFAFGGCETRVECAFTRTGDGGVDWTVRDDAGTVHASGHGADLRVALRAAAQAATAALSVLEAAARSAALLVSPDGEPVVGP